MCYCCHFVLLYTFKQLYQNVLEQQTIMILFFLSFFSFLFFFVFVIFFMHLTFSFFSVSFLFFAFLFFAFLHKVMDFIFNILFSKLFYGKKRGVKTFSNTRIQSNIYYTIIIIIIIMFLKTFNHYTYHHKNLIVKFLNMLNLVLFCFLFVSFFHLIFI